MAAKLRRQSIIKRILRERSISNQEQLLKMLHNEGFKVTQATLSRDFADLGVIRTFTDIGVRYVISSDDFGKHISKLVGLEILNVSHNENVILMRTIAGRAQGVAHYIDRLNRQEILGTIGGDDTVLVIPDKVKNIPGILELIDDIIARKPE